MAQILPMARDAGIPVVYIKDVSRVGWPEHMLDMPEIIAPQDGDFVSEKMHGNAFQNTDLDSLLENLGVSRLLITGLASHSCVTATVIGAQIKGYEVVILSDGHSGGQRGATAIRMNGTWESQGLLVISSTDLEWENQCTGSGT